MEKLFDFQFFHFSSIEIVTTHLLKKSTSFLDAQEF